MAEATKRKPGRPKTVLGRTGVAVQTKIPPQQASAIAEIVESTGLTQAQIVRAAISEWLVKYKRRSGGTKTPLEPSQTA